MPRSLTRSVLSCGALDGDGRRKMTPEGLYGRRKMTALLRRTSADGVSAGAVDRAMRTLGLSGVRRDKGIRTTIPAKDGKRAGDLLDRDFTAKAPNRAWVTDFTHCRTWAGWVYVAFIVDVFAQRIVAWHTATNKEVDLVMTPLRMALWERGREGHPKVAGELIHHSDAGSQYTSIRLTDHLMIEGILPSIGSVGDAYDNALMESINGLYKAECIRTTIFHEGPYRSIIDIEFATVGLVDAQQEAGDDQDTGADDRTNDNAVAPAPGAQFGADKDGSDCDDADVGDTVGACGHRHAGADEVEPSGQPASRWCRILAKSEQGGPGDETTGDGPRARVDRADHEEAEWY